MSMPLRTLGKPHTHLPAVTILWGALLLILVGVVLLPSSPIFYIIPNNDSSMFQYIGKKILMGQFPFRDWYDHKPPAVFYWNALGLWLGAGSPWGLWGLELASLSATALFGFAFLRRYFATWIAGLSVCAFLVNLAYVLERGNLTEEYALPFLFASLLLLSSIERKPHHAGRFIALGALLGIASTFKQPMAGLTVAVVIFLALFYHARDDFPGLLRAYLLLGLGFVAVWAVWFVYFALVGVFADFWEAAFAYNFALSGISLEKRMQAFFLALFTWGGSGSYFLGGMLTWLTVLPYLWRSDARLGRFLVSRWVAAGLLGAGGVLLLRALLSSPGAGLAWPAWALALFVLCLGWAFWRGWPRRAVAWARVDEAARSPLALPLTIALVDFPVAFLLCILSGNNYSHYFIALLPSLSILIAFLIWLLQRSAFLLTGRAMGLMWVVILLIGLFLPGIQRTQQEMVPKTDRQVQALIDYVDQHTRPGDTVLQWGVTPAINLITGRDAPTRFFFADPLFVPGYSGERQTQILLHDLTAHPPQLIIDARMARLPLVTAPPGTACAQVRGEPYYQKYVHAMTNDWSVLVPMPDGMGMVYDWICQHYIREATVGELQWDVYRWKGN